MAASSFSGLEGQKNEHNSDMEEDMDLTEDDFRNVSGQFSREASTATVTDAVNASVETVKVDVSSKTGVKRARTISTEHQPSVHVTYKHLTRASKQKLESLLQQWSEWEAEQTSLLCQSDQDQEPALESGEDTYFPALRVGLQNTSSVSFWFDCKTGQDSLKEFVPVESSTTPLYNRKFTIGLDSTVGSSNVEGGLEIVDDDPPRCFNCGAYSHSLRECPKPFDRSAVSIARRQHKSKRNQAPGSRLPSRYYKSAQGGKYDGLKPGSLDPETRQLLGLGELDPPPWLHRMREIGYPPGYLAVEEDHLSGITIFDEEDTKPEEEEKEEGEVKAEDGEILEVASSSQPEMKMTVEFPGINAPIPENADVWLWQQRKNTGYGYSHDHQYRGVMGPPGLELSSSYPPRYGGGIRYDHGFGSRPPSPISELGRRYYYSPYNQDLR